jgi:hypothetical protein
MAAVVSTEVPQLPARTVAGAQVAWRIIAATWDTTMERAQAMPESRLHERVGGEWSFVQTLRHLVYATDAWVRRAILGEPEPYHRLGLPPDPDPGEEPPDVRPWGIDIDADPSFAEVVGVRRDRTATVQRVIEGLTPAEYSRICAQHPAPGFPPVTRFPVSLGLDVVLGEEWAHHAYAVRDLDALDARA